MLEVMKIEEQIPDEVLAAYIDGNATPEESAMIQNALGADDLLSEAVDVVSDINSYGDDIDWTIMDDINEPMSIDVSVDIHPDNDVAAEVTPEEPLSIEPDVSPLDTAEDVSIHEYGTDDLFDFSV